MTLVGRGAEGAGGGGEGEGRGWEWRWGWDSEQEPGKVEEKETYFTVESRDGKGNERTTFSR
jgi:hypothetical protein